MSKTAELNPMEALATEMADFYVEKVQELTEFIAPVRPWWHRDLSPDEQVWRWLDVREPVMAWLMTTGAYMGFESGDAVMDNLAAIFTDERIVDLVPAEHVIAIPIPLLEMVQGNGPEEAAKHIRKMERMAEGRAKALGLLEQNRVVNVPEPPDVPPPLPVDVIGSPGWPLYGGAPQEDTV